MGRRNTRLRVRFRFLNFGFEGGERGVRVGREVERVRGGLVGVDEGMKIGGVDGSG